MFAKPFVYNLLLRNYKVLKHLPFYGALWDRTISPSFNVKTKIYGSDAVIPSTFSLPLITRMFDQFNNPYLQLVHMVHQEKGKRLNIIDAGASVGDGFFLLVNNVPDA